jgi:hypothetical protein
MPPLTRWFIKTALVYLVLSLFLSVLVVAGTALPVLHAFSGLSSLYLHLLMIGWITQLIFGVAYWMFPIFSREEPRRSTTLGWLSYVSLNAGLAMRLSVDVTPVVSTLHTPSWIGGLAATLLFIAAVAFVANTWQRVKGN